METYRNRGSATGISDAVTTPVLGMNHGSWNSGKAPTTGSPQPAPRQTYAAVLKDQKAGAGALLSGHDAPEPHKIFALPFKGNAPYLVVAYASISVPGTLGKMVGKAPTVKLSVSEGKLEAPPNYAAVE